MSDSALRSACHPSLFLFLCLRLSECFSSFSVSCSHSIYFSPSPFLSGVAVLWGKSGGVTFWRSWGIIGRVFLFSFQLLFIFFLNIYLSLPALCVALNEGRCHSLVCLETQTDVFLRCKIWGGEKTNSGVFFSKILQWKSDIVTVLKEKKTLFLHLRTIYCFHSERFTATAVMIKLVKVKLHWFAHTWWKLFF